MINFIKNNSKYLTISGAFTLLVICYFQQKQNARLRSQLYIPTVNIDSIMNTNDSLQHRLDSVEAELFPKEIELNRYEIAFRIFAERNPKAAEQYGNIISDETE
jgi:hypothetical protein